MNIYIPIEIKVRELDGKLLLALMAAERGHTVILGDKSDTRKLAVKGILPPGIYHNKSITPSEQTLLMLQKLKKNKHIVTCQDEESGLLDESYDEFARLRFSGQSIALTARVYAWGEHDAEALKRIYPIYRDKIQLTGSPRVDYWREEFRPYYQNIKSNKLPAKKKPFFLIASNFGTLLNENPFWDVVERLREAGYFEREPGRERHEYMNFAYQTQLVHEFVVMIRKLSADFPEHTILVRPHPVESIEAWKKIIGAYSNVVVIRDGSISGWIHEAELLIHNGCTTAIEAAASNLPRIAYRPIPSEIERSIPNEISENVFSYEELVSKIHQTIHTPGENKSQKNEKHILSGRFGNLSGKLAAERIVDDWEQVGAPIQQYQATLETLLHIKKGRSARFSNPLKTLKSLITKISSRFISPKAINKKSDNLKTGHKFPSFTNEELADKMENLRHTLNRFHHVRFVRFGKRSFIIYCEKSDS